VARDREDPLEQLHAARQDGLPVRPPGRGPTERFKVGGSWLLAGLGLLVAAQVVSEQGKRPYPSLAPSCTTAAIAVTPSPVEVREDVRYSYVGPDGDVLIALNAAAVSADGIATPSSPGAVTQVFEEDRIFDCRSRGEFPAAVPAGEHVVTAFRLVDGRWTAMASTELVVR
jgi:hypothetical protein